jgi:ATP-dependent protease ClpP protease subunit
MDRNNARAKPYQWEVKAAADGTADLYIYGDIIEEGDRYWYYSDSEEPVSVVSMRDALDSAGNVHTINLYVASSGGDFAQGLAIHSLLARHGAKVIGHVEGFAASAATIILAAADEVHAPSNAMLLYHDVSIGILGYYNAAKLRDLADYCDRFQPMIVASYQAKNPKLTDAEITDLLAQDVWITADEAASYGLVDVVGEALPLAAKAREAATGNLPDSLEAALNTGVEEPQEDREAEIAALAESRNAVDRALREL